MPKKLGLGFACIEGDPPDFRGVNIPSPSGEQIGDGAASMKASGILCVEGVLYVWPRNAGNSRLAWSKDHGKMWQWVDWKLTKSFGCPTFLNFGRNYANARDDFVYIYSHDADSAYQAADRMVLARVPRRSIKERNTYEFFQGIDEKGQPLWSKEIADRGAVFTSKDIAIVPASPTIAVSNVTCGCRSSPGSEGKKADTRFEGGLAIYDASEPWGPWTTVYFAEKWDVAPVIRPASRPNG